MGKKYPRYICSTSGSPTFDRRWSFEVQPSKIITYHAESGEFAEELPLTTRMKIRVWEKMQDGSGNCDVNSANGSKIAGFCIYHEVEEFATEVKMVTEDKVTGRSRAEIEAEIQHERELERPLVEKMRECVHEAERIMSEKSLVPWPLSMAWKVERNSRHKAVEDVAQKWADRANVHVARIRLLNNM